MHPLNLKYWLWHFISAPIHSQGGIAPTSRPFQPHQHISFGDPIYPLKAADHTINATSGTDHGSRVGSALGMVNTSINSPTDCHFPTPTNRHHTVGTFLYVFDFNWWDLNHNFKGNFILRYLLNNFFLFQ